LPAALRAGNFKVVEPHWKSLDIGSIELPIDLPR
jgi:hypothetical protein